MSSPEEVGSIDVRQPGELPQPVGESDAEQPSMFRRFVSFVLNSVEEVGKSEADITHIHPF
ncbi:MAG: hypothetical protein ACHQT9_02555 [Candidatus Saccharimonadales bacterium]